MTVRSMTVSEYLKQAQDTRREMHALANDIAEAVVAGMKPDADLVERYTKARAAYEQTMRDMGWVTHGA